MALASGSRLGSYEILSVLGAGGMGEVYRARDPRLGRDVAIKVLPAAFSHDPDRLRRFEQEARAAAALNHPNILTVHEIATHEGQPYVVSELLDGQTLRDTIPRDGMPVKKAIDAAVQICRGLAAAHDKGIVHRDLKPENVFVTTDGRIKILDFGLAKLTEAGAMAAAGGTMEMTRAANTSAGLVLGTVGYMSPEQARGLPVDHRSDLFNLGSTLYEMLSGVRAFSGPTTADTVSAILGDDPPDLTNAPRSIAPGLDRIVRHCLEKSPSQRFQSASDVAFALEAMTGSPSGTTATAHISDRRVRWGAPSVLATTAIIATVIGALAGLWWTARRNARADVDRLSIAELARLTHEVGFSEWPTWYRDGNLFAYSSNKSGNFEIYVRQVQGGEEHNITNDQSDDVQPAFSPDGTQIAFVSTRSSKTRLIKSFSVAGDLVARSYGGDVWVGPALGGRPSRLAEDANFPAWRPDSLAIAYVTGPEWHRAIIEMPLETRGARLEGRAARTLLALTASKWEITRLQYSPDGTWLTFESADGQIMAMPSAGGAPQPLVQGYSHAWDPMDPRLYYVNNLPAGGARMMSAEITELKDRLVAVPTIVAMLTGFFGQTAVARDGRHVLTSEMHESLNLTRMQLAMDGGATTGVEEELSTSGQVVRDGYPAVSPDSGRVLISTSRLGPNELWTVDLKSRNWEQIQLPQKGCADDRGAWAPDGARLIVTCTFTDGTFSIWSVALDGSTYDELVSHMRGNISSTYGDLSNDGNWLLYGAVKDGRNQIFKVDVRTKQASQLTSSPSDKYDAHWSPDDKWIVYSATDTGTAQAWIMSVATGEERVLTSSRERMRHVFFSPDGKWVYVQPSHRNIYRRPVEGGPDTPLRPVTNFPESGLFLEEPTISPDGKYLYYCKSRGGSSLWQLTLSARRPSLAGTR